MKSRNSIFSRNWGEDFEEKKTPFDDISCCPAFIRKHFRICNRYRYLNRTQSPSRSRLEQERFLIFPAVKCLNGVVIDSIGTCSYPQSSETGYWQLRPEAEEMVALASSIGMDTIFYPVNPQMGSMYHSSYLKQNPALSKDGGFSLKDPLKSLIKESESSGLSLCAVISPFVLEMFLIMSSTTPAAIWIIPSW